MNASESNQYNEQLMEIQNAIDLKKKKKAIHLKKTDMWYTEINPTQELGVNWGHLPKQKM